jgi:hypothetical protein
VFRPECPSSAAFLLRQTERWLGGRTPKQHEVVNSKLPLLSNRKRGELG